MVRFALFLGACVFLVFFSLNSQPLQNAPDLAFERNDTAHIVPSTLLASSTPYDNQLSDEVPDEMPRAEAEQSLVLDEIPVKNVTEVASSSPLTPESSMEPPRALSFPPEVLNGKVRAALVNILCEASAPLRSTSGSGIIIDPRGIIITNAHIAQYFLLEERALVSCTIRSGSPARGHWRAQLIFIPEQWIKKHAGDILNSRATGTGEHDYAFLAITETLDSSPIPTFPFVGVDAEEATSATGDPVLIAGYPAEFVGGSAARSSLHASTVFSNIKQLLTFSEGVVDVISVGGTVLAQSGSSGGGFVDLYGSLLGLIVTTSLGDTTGLRDLHAITPAHIDRSIRQHTGSSLKVFLTKSRENLLQDFASSSAPLSKYLSDAIESQQD